MRVIENMRKIFPLLCGIALLAGCMDFDDATETIDVTVQVGKPEGFLQTVVSGRTVTLKGGVTLTAITDAEGRAVFKGIVPDVYNISTSWKVNAEEYAQATGNATGGNAYTVTGTLPEQLLSATTTEALTLATTISQDQSILIGKVYYQGGKYKKDEKDVNYIYSRYVTLYNNTAETINVTNLYLALMESKSPTSDYPLQYLTDTVVAKQVFRIPDHSLLPGGTILLTNSAIDHSIETLTQPDLLDADYEAKDQVTRPIHVNNPAVKALELVYSYTTISMMNLTQGGPCSLAIFQTDEDVATTWPNIYLTYAYGRNSGSQFMKIPARCIIDAVDILKYNGETGADASNKRFFDYLDAGYTYTTAKTGYDSKAVVRKVLYTTDDGRAVLQDTNNSSNDFETTENLTPRSYQ